MYVKTKKELNCILITLSNVSEYYEIHCKKCTNSSFCIYERGEKSEWAAYGLSFHTYCIYCGYIKSSYYDTSFIIKTHLLNDNNTSL
jgi:hypothetical protein